MITKDHKVVSLRNESSSGIYTVPDAALYLRSTTPPPVTSLRRWSPNRHQFIAPSSRHLYAWIRQALEGPSAIEIPARDLVIDFGELIRLRMIVILRSRGLSFKVIQDGENVARRLTRSQQPFVTEPMWTSSSDIFLEVAGMLVAASRGGQLAMEFLREYFTPVHHGLTFGHGGVAAAWQPISRVSIDPAIQFGAPCIEGTRIQTEVLWSLHQAGESIDALAEMYGVHRDDVRAALAWEQTLAAAA